MSGSCERGFMLMFKKFGILGALSESLEPHLFGRTEALKFGTIGVHRRYELSRSWLDMSRAPSHDILKMLVDWVFCLAVLALGQTPYKSIQALLILALIADKDKERRKEKENHL